MLKRIHVNQHTIRANTKSGARDPVLTVKTYRDGDVRSHRENRYGNDVRIAGPARVVYAPDDPLACGARVWIETEAPVTVDGAPV